MEKSIIPSRCLLHEAKCTSKRLAVRFAAIKKYFTILKLITILYESQLLTKDVNANFSIFAIHAQ